MTLDSRTTWAAPAELIRTLQEARQLYRPRKIGRGHELYRQGECSTKFYLIDSGLIKISIFREDGTEVILEFMGSGTICGEGAALDRLARFSSAVAVEDTELLEFDTAGWSDEEQGMAPVLMALMRITALKQRVLALRLEQLFSREPENRIMELFHRLAQMAPQIPESSIAVLPQLTHEHIAAMTGMTRVTVTRALHRLRSRGNVIQHDGRFRLAGSTESVQKGA
ncbi:MAG: Crp/Fnr family transcriptional regulator [Pararhodobacter sp.]|nr:Crp/Fnr family transcriptional regulator [Pararhodobacter sp.]